MMKSIVLYPILGLQYTYNFGDNKMTNSNSINEERIKQDYVDQCIGYLVNLRSKECIYIDNRYVENPIYGKALTNTDIKALGMVFKSFAQEPNRRKLKGYRSGQRFVPVSRDWRNRIIKINNKLGCIFSFHDDGFYTYSYEVFLDDEHLLDLTYKMYAVFGINKEEVA